MTIVNCKEERKDSSFLHAQQQLSISTTAVQKDKIIYCYNSGDVINGMIYPYQCQISDNNMIEEHASPPIKYHTSKEYHPTPPPFYDPGNTTFSSAFNNLNSQSQQQLHLQPSSSAASTALLTPKSSKKYIFNTFHADKTISAYVDDGRSISTPTRTYKKFKNLSIVDNDDIYNDLQQQPNELPKRYVCIVCGKKFVRPSSLTTHTYSHTGEKPYKCGICGRQFSVISNLRRHGKVHTNTSSSSFCAD